MRNIVIVLILSILVPLVSIAQNNKAAATTNEPTGHAIQIILKPYQNTKIYIGTNYGKNRVLADSTILNAQSEGVFESKTKLTPGIYFVVSPKYSILFDFLVDEKQHFKIDRKSTRLNSSHT